MILASDCVMLHLCHALLCAMYVCYAMLCSIKEEGGHYLFVLFDSVLAQWGGEVVRRSHQTCDIILYAVLTLHKNNRFCCTPTRQLSGVNQMLNCITHTSQLHSHNSSISYLPIACHQYTHISTHRRPISLLLEVSSHINTHAHTRWQQTAAPMRHLSI